MGLFPPHPQLWPHAFGWSHDDRSSILNWQVIEEAFYVFFLKGGGPSLPSWHTLSVPCCVSAEVSIRQVIDFCLVLVSFSLWARFTLLRSSSYFFTWSHEQLLTKTSFDAPGKCPTCPEDLLQYLVECENCDWFLFQLEVFGNHLPSVLFQGNSWPDSKRDYLPQACPLKRLNILNVHIFFHQRYHCFIEVRA